jgi:DNA-binding HxlR family transcriptional regulator
MAPERADSAEDNSRQPVQELNWNRVVRSHSFEVIFPRETPGMHSGKQHGGNAMSRDGGYGQFCPVAKASEIVATRWTPLILRELVSGSHRFNDIHRGVPLMSRALLTQRLRDLEQAGIIHRVTPAGARIAEYHLTKSGQELQPIIIALGVWGQRWVESALESAEWDAGVLMWDMRRRVDTTVMPQGRNVIQFEFAGAPDEMRVWWLVVEHGKTDLCQSDPGFEVDLYVATDVPTLARIWIGKDSLRRAIEADEVAVTGDATLRRTITRWLKLSALVEAAQQWKTVNAA